MQVQVVCHSGNGLAIRSYEIPDGVKRLIVNKTTNFLSYEDLAYEVTLPEGYVTLELPAPVAIEDPAIFIA